MKELFTDPYQIAKYIKDAQKQTLVKVFLNGDISNIDFKDAKVFGSNNSYTIIGNYQDIEDGLSKFDSKDYYLEHTARNSAVPSLDITKVNARIEPGAFIRDHVTIGNNAVIMMGAIINIGASIGDETMIDMNAVLGARATIGNRVHVGAGSVIAGVLEPPSATPVIIEDDVLIGANAVVLEGVRVGANSVVAAGAVVINDVPAGVIVAGSPARIIKETKDLDQSKKELLDDLRK